MRTYVPTADRLRSVSKPYQTSTTERPIVNGKQEPAQLKIEIPANRSDYPSGQSVWNPPEADSFGRYDMLCFEGISLMLNIFRGKRSSPNYRLIPPSDGELETITVHEEVGEHCGSI